MRNYLAILVAWLVALAMMVDVTEFEPLIRQLTNYLVR